RRTGLRERTHSTGSSNPEGPRSSHSQCSFMKLHLSNENSWPEDQRSRHGLGKMLRPSQWATLYTQISRYLNCPRRYRHRYLDGWHEKDSRAAMLFGRVFEQALGAYFRREDAPVTLYREWAQYKVQPLHYSERDSWDQMLKQRIQLLERFSQDDRVHVAQSGKKLQLKFVGPFSEPNEFVAYIDAIGRLDGRACLLQWKTTSSATRMSRMDF